MANLSAKREYWQPISLMLWLATAIAVAEPCFSEGGVTAVYTFPDTPIKDFQNKFLPDSIAN